MKQPRRSALSLIVVWVIFLVGLDGVDAAASTEEKSPPARKPSSQTTQSTSKPKSLPATSTREVSQSSASTPQSSKSKKPTSKKRARSKKGGVRGQKEIETSRVVQIQQALAAAGFYKEEPSGKWDVTTTQAMSAYQDANGFRVTGKPDALSLKKLGL